MTVPCPVADRRRLSGVPWKEGAPVAAANSICSSVLDVTHLLLFFVILSLDLHKQQILAFPTYLK